MKLLKNQLDQIFKKMRDIYFPPIDTLVRLLHQEIYQFRKVDLSFHQRFKAYSNGFTSRLYRICELEHEDDINLYLSNFSRRAYTRSINQNSDFLNNKQKFYDFMSEHGLHQYLPELLGIIKDGEFKCEKSIDDYLQNKKKIVLKPCKGSCGSGVYICELEGKHVILNGEKKKLKEFDSLVKSLSRKYIVTEYCEQADFLNKIYPKSANTVRIWTVTTKSGKTFVPTAILRMGTKKSGMLDNVNQGGLTALINLETGELSKGASLSPSGEVKWYEKHPGSSTQIEGFVIPNWKTIKNKLLSLVSDLSEFKYVGWDLVIKDNKGSFVIIEGNSHPGLQSIQVHKPLLEDPRVRNFYRENGIPV